jgi:N4-(beta-N-acetylglucosaminyl)-L-asparaginase
MRRWNISHLQLVLKFLFLFSLTNAMVLPIVVNTWPFTAATHEAYLSLTSSPTTDPIDAVVAGCSKAEELQCDYTVGWGGSPDSNGETTLDAMVMRGCDQNMGAVAGLRGIKDATKVARDVMVLTKHSLLAGDLATDFAKDLGYESGDLRSDYSRKLYKEWKENGCLPNFWTDGRSCNGTAEGESAMQKHFNEHNHDTISQIALQADGRMAVGLSSNGARHKIAGRVGDAPLPGAGGYVDDEVGACVATGDGDVMMRHCPAFLGVELMRGGMSPQGAADEAIRRISKKSKDFSGAVVCMDKFGVHAAAYQGFNRFSYSVQSGGKSEKDVKVIKIQPLTIPTREQKVLLESHWGVA